MTEGQVWDEGLQPERTSLAWRRAGVSFLALGLATPKVAWPLLHGWSIAVAAVVLAGGVLLLVSSHRRYDRLNRSLTGALAGSLPDGRLPALATCLALLLAVLALGLLLAVRLGLGAPNG